MMQGSRHGPSGDHPEPEGPEARIVAICALGLASPAIERIVQTARAECAVKDRIPLLITDNPHLAAFVPFGMRVELVVDVVKSALRQPAFDWPRHRVDQFELIGRRWQPAQVATFGESPPTSCLDALSRGALRPL